MLSSIRNKRKRGMCYAIIDGSRGQGECNMQDWRQGGNQIVSGETRLDVYKRQVFKKAGKAGTV